uniref:Uncharacterized protein n=1 Tax=Kalanchoe fedtschenkoi TaxID=63787 RepID=A0A7N0UDN8_KALFE
MIVNEAYVSNLKFFLNSSQQILLSIPNQIEDLLSRISIVDILSQPSQSNPVKSNTGETVTSSESPQLNIYHRKAAAAQSKWSASRQTLGQRDLTGSC